MNRGFYLTLMMGGFNASPVPQPVIDALTDVQVNSALDSQGGFQLKFTLGKNSPVQNMLNSGYFDPPTRVIIAVTVNGSTEVLMDGIITKQDVTPSIAAGKSTLTITGLDLTAVMDLIDLTGVPYPAIPFFLIVEAILAKYAVLGVVPIAVPTVLSLVNNPLDKFSKQQGTDYGYITNLGRELGAVFYLDPGPQPGMSTAYWGPDITRLFGGAQGGLGGAPFRFAAPAQITRGFGSAQPVIAPILGQIEAGITRLFGGAQPALSINFDASSNIDSLSFSYDGTMATQYVVTIIEQNSQLPIPIPVPNITLLKAPLAAHTPPVLKVTQLTPSASENPVEAALAGLGKLFEISDPITGSGQLDVLRYGQVFKVRQLAAVRGAGSYYDGRYYVKSVTHNIKRGEYKQSFTLARGGVGTDVSTVGA
jgi:hypothetical protein